VNLRDQLQAHLGNAFLLEDSTLAPTVGEAIRAAMSQATTVRVVEKVEVNQLPTLISNPPSPA
jgi:hypothetical protein